MSYTERSLSILEYLKKNKKASVEELSAYMYVSAATIRRDLNEMQKMGQIERSHGGAILVENADEISIFVRQIKNAREKERTASVALKRLPEFSTVFIDNSSTCLALTERMNFSHKTVVTNGLQVAMSVARHDGVTLIMPGGEIRYNTSAVLGSKTIEMLENCRFDLALTSCTALNANGCYEVSLDSMQIKKTALHNSKRRILIFDKTKINTTALFRTAALDEFDALITDADDETLAPLRRVGNITIINR